MELRLTIVLARGNVAPELCGHTPEIGVYSLMPIAEENWSGDVYTCIVDQHINSAILL